LFAPACILELSPAALCSTFLSQAAEEERLRAEQAARDIEADNERRKVAQESADCERAQALAREAAAVCLPSSKDIAFKYVQCLNS
jgi:hypothetical protein